MPLGNGGHYEDYTMASGNGPAPCTNGGIMAGMNLKQIEADVVFVASNKVNGTVRIQPIWECDIPPDELMGMSARFALRANEQDRSGEV